MGGSIVGLRLSTFRGNVRLSVQQKCHRSNPGSHQMSTAPVVRFAAAVLSKSSEKVRTNWPAEMSHSLHGECDIEPERANETASFERPAGGADYVGSGGRVDGSELTPRSTHAGGLPGSGCSFPRPWPPWPPTGQRHIRGGDRRRGASGRHSIPGSQPYPSE